MRLPARYLPHIGLVAYKPKLGDGAYGPVHGGQVVPERAAIDETRRLVRNKEGREVVSEARIALDLPDHEALTVGSEVTLWKGRPNERTTTVIAVSIAEWPRLPRFLEAALE